ncbi:chaplin [Streptomyces albus]|uniref:chaplin n=1 Tax=Streptomyces albus TaxID=1888 RepID=UPI0004C7574A|nr:chaplin [Streptomyces albus]
MIKKVVAVAAAAGGIMFAGAGMAAADSGAEGSSADSPGIVSGNVIQAPVNLPVNLCGTTVSVIGAMNPAYGSSCSS